ncbi:EVE domain-containing protein [Coxiella-like endosymbiont of Rhipicephalus sanguineus]|nr:EVE domain-containing protein [Coxiella-like endosymbiont of Rhipicephalus sanguineus]
MVDIQFKKKFDRTVTLEELRIPPPIKGYDYFS